MAASDLFWFDRCARRVLAEPVIRRLPDLRGLPVRIQEADGLRHERGPVHAGSFLRERRIAFDCTRSEFPRIFTHELAHFVWLRLGNRRRLEYEEIVRRELLAGARGELGWSAERRKRVLPAVAWQERRRAWREYCCESFCDSAAWLWSGVRNHAEFTLAIRYRKLRAAWFARETAGPLSI